MIESYRPVETVEAGPLAKALALGVLGGAVLGVAYQVVVDAIPIAFVRPVVTVAAAWLLLRLATWAAHSARSPSVAAVAAIGLACAAATWATTWPMAYLGGTDAMAARRELGESRDTEMRIRREREEGLSERTRQRMNGEDVAEPAPAPSPVLTTRSGAEVRAELGFWDYFSRMVEHGREVTFGADTMTLSGAVVIAAWLAEILLLGAAAMRGAGRGSLPPFCPRCRRFTEEVGVRSVVFADVRRLRRAVAEDDLATVLSVPRDPVAGGIAVYRVFSCPSCKEGAYLDLDAPSAASVRAGTRARRLAASRTAAAGSDAAPVASPEPRRVAPGEVDASRLLSGAVLTSEQRDALLAARGRHAAALGRRET